MTFELVAEMATCAGQSKVDWPFYQAPGVDYPQTEERKFPGRARIAIGGMDAGQVQLADDPADAAGMFIEHRRSGPRQLWLSSFP